MVDAESKARIVVSIGAPVFIGDGWDWACPYRISGLKKTLFGHAPGIDGIQALQLVGLDIRDALEKTKRNFSWLDQPYWQIGFPRFVNGIGIPAFDRHLERVIENEYRRFPADLKAWRARARSKNSLWRAEAESRREPVEAPLAKVKTQPTKASVAAFLNAIENDQRRADSKAVARLMQDVTGEKPAMWGPSIVGFGSDVYTGTKAGGVWPLAAFSPRKENLTMYLMPGFGRYAAELMAKLGPHSTGKSCLYVKRLSDLHQPTLRKLLAASIRHSKK